MALGRNFKYGTYLLYCSLCIKNKKDVALSMEFEAPISVGTHGRYRLSLACKQYRYITKTISIRSLTVRISEYQVTVQIFLRILHKENSALGGISVIVNGTTYVTSTVPVQYRLQLFSWYLYRSLRHCCNNPWT
jgi:hypothetical protein